MSSIQSLLIMLAVVAMLQRQPSFAGVWEGKMNDQPAILLTVTNANQQVAGNITFYFQTKQSGQWKVDRANTEPLIDAKIDGRKLSFKVSHANAHPGTESSPTDPPVPFSFVLISAREGKLTSDYQGQHSEITLTKTK